MREREKKKNREKFNTRRDINNDSFLWIIFCDLLQACECPFNGGTSCREKCSSHEMIIGAAMRSHSSVIGFHSIS